ncbi:hypothetical protein GVv1_40170 [Enterobacter pseudoroggenkampii]
MKKLYPPLLAVLTVIGAMGVSGCDSKEDAGVKTIARFKEHIDAGITLADAVNFLVDKYELVRIDRRGFNWQEQSPYLRAVDILRARQATGLLRRSRNNAVS